MTDFLRRNIGQLSLSLVLSTGALFISTPVYAQTNQALEKRVEQLEQRLMEMDAKLAEKESRPAAPAPAAPLVDLSDDMEEPDRRPGRAYLGRWFDRMTMSGMGAVRTWNTQDNGKNPQSSFHLWESRIRFNVNVWSNVSFFVENEWARDGSSDRTAEFGEIYVRFDDLQIPGLTGAPVSMKAGRFQIPFGVEYLIDDAPDNPLVTHSAPWIWGWDEGVEAFGKFRGVEYVAAVMDGGLNLGTDRSSDKSYSLKLIAHPASKLEVSLSGLRSGVLGNSGTGNTESWADFFSTVSAPLSGDSTVKLRAWEIGARYKTSEGHHLLGYAGQVDIHDHGGPQFDRDINYYVYEGLYRIKRRFFLVARISAIGTFDPTRGYNFSGTNGSSVGSNVTKYLKRRSFGGGFWMNENTVFKVEVANEDWGLINSATVAQQSTAGKRNQAGVQVAVKF